MNRFIANFISYQYILVILNHTLKPVQIKDWGQAKIIDTSTDCSITISSVFIL